MDAVQTYLNLVEDAEFANGEYLIEINIFKDSKIFSKYFFNYFKNSYYLKIIPYYLQDIIATRTNFINKSNFIMNDFNEGILYEWLTIFNAIREEYNG